jgi:hypothetical protein
LGISNTAVTPPRIAARLPLGVARLAEMHLGIHHPGQHMQPLGVEHLGRLGGGQGANGSNAAADNPNISGGNAVGRGDNAPPDQKVKRRIGRRKNTHGFGS